MIVMTNRPDSERPYWFRITLRPRTIDELEAITTRLLDPRTCPHCGFIGRGHIHSLPPVIDAAFIAKYPSGGAA